MTPIEAYTKARESGYTRKLEEIACKEPAYACYFAHNIPGANIEYCQKWACKDSRCTYWFARYVPGADLNFCQEKACKDPEDAYRFARHIKGADLNYCLEACKGTEYYAQIQGLIMEEALG